MERGTDNASLRDKTTTEGTLIRRNGRAPLLLSQVFTDFAFLAPLRFCDSELSGPFTESNERVERTRCV